MSRLALLGGLLVLSVGLILGQARTNAVAPVPEKPEVKKDEPAPVAALRAPLKDLPEIPVDPQITLSSVLKSLSDRLRVEHKLDVDFHINEAAFKAEGAVESVKDLHPVASLPLGAVRKATLENYLRTVLDRVNVGSGVTYVLRKDGIEITTVNAARAQIWGGHKGPYLALVHTQFDKKPLDEALKELVDLTDHNIVLDVRVENGKQPVTARFLNTPLDTAVTLLADMAGLGIYMQDNVIYVTTRENALRWETRTKKNPAEDPDNPGPRIGTGVRGHLGPVAPPMGL